MSKALILVEGQTDRGVVKTIIERLKLSGSVRLMRGNRVEKLVGFVRTNQKRDKIIVLKDMEKYKEKSINKRFNAIKTRLHPSERNKVRLIIVRRAIEAWLLADPKAIEKAFGCRIGVIAGMTDEIRNPAEELDKMLRKCGKRYLKGELMAAKIARELDLKRVMKNSESFKTFYESLLAP
jgi:hypothetical protein